MASNLAMKDESHLIRARKPLAIRILIMASKMNRNWVHKIIQSQELTLFYLRLRE